MASPCNNAVAQRIALVVLSGREVDELLTDVLSDEGWSIQRVVDNREALLLASTTPFDLIITGQETRALEDVELFRKIRSSRPHTRMIILTDKWIPGDVIAAMREGAFSYFSPHSRLPNSPPWYMRLWQRLAGMTVLKSLLARPLGCGWRRAATWPPQSA